MKTYKRNDRETAYQILIDNLLDAQAKNLDTQPTVHEKEEKKELILGLLRHARSVDLKAKPAAGGKKSISSTAGKVTSGKEKEKQEREQLSKENPVKRRSLDDSRIEETVIKEATGYGEVS